MTPVVLTDGGIKAIDRAFAAAKSEGRSALITYLTAGYPTAAETLDLVAALEAGGADLIELGVPFSDPVADGPTIQRAAQVALEAGMTPRRCIEAVEALRARGVGVPIVLMGYYNPIHAYGLNRFVADSAAAGVEGLIVPDLPPEEAARLAWGCRSHGLALIFLVAPTTGEARIARLAQETSGFLYVVSRLGITGAGQAPDLQPLRERLAVVRRHARTPVAVGFGISEPEQVRALAHLADGLVVGSAVVQRAADGPDALRAYVETLSAALGG